MEPNRHEHAVKTGVEEGTKWHSCALWAEPSLGMASAFGVVFHILPHSGWAKQTLTVAACSMTRLLMRWSGPASPVCATRMGGLAMAAGHCLRTTMH